MLDNYFNFKENGTDFKTEIIAGITTFLAMAYILGVNPTMLADGGMPASGVFFATAVSSGIACIIMGIVSKYPLGLAPGMGLNAVFTYSIILEMGNTWETALAAVFISSIIFLIISISGLRKRILDNIPNDLKLGIGAGVGFFIAFLGLKSCGIIISDPSTFVKMGPLLTPPTLLALTGILITLIMYIRKVPASIFFGLLTTAIIGLIFTFIGIGAGDAMMPKIPEHIVSFNIDFSLVGGFARGFGQLFTNIANLIIMVFSLVFIAFFDATGTLLTIGKQCGFIDENGNPKGIEKAFLSDAMGGIIGSILGTSTVTAYVESSIGIEIGGRTGLTAVVTGILFILSIFISPLILSLFTSYVTAAALVVVGILMVSQIKDINWNDPIISASVFLTILIMILSYSISTGIAWGFLIYVIGNIAKGEYKKMKIGMWILAIILLLYLFFGL